jgi:hypothetical protein
MISLLEVLQSLAISQPQRKFIYQLFKCWFAVQGRVNFLQLSRYSQHTERYFRRWFRKAFDIAAFNLAVLSRLPAGKWLIAVDTVTWGKAGKRTYGIGWFWSSTVGQAIRGVEFFTIALVSTRWRTAFHTAAAQTNGQLSKSATRIDSYIAYLLKQLPALRQWSRYIVADGFFVKLKFVQPLLQAGFVFISKLRKDADLYYLYEGPVRKGRGRRKTRDGKINFHDLSRLQFVTTLDGWDIYHTKAYSKNLRCLIRLVYIDVPAAKSYALLMCSDLKLPPLVIIHYYRLRFQIEFLYRDAKQHTGLTHCQSANRNAMRFHANAALSAINLAKTDQLHQNNFASDTAFSIADYKTLKSNEHFAQFIFCKLDFDLSQPKIKSIFHHCLSYGLIHYSKAA